MAEYRAMFMLCDGDVAAGRRVLDCGGGPASFTSEAAARGVHAVSTDPLYGVPASAIARRIDEARPTILENTRINAADFVWGRGIRDTQHLDEIRTAAMAAFLDDYAGPGRAAGRYVRAALPRLPFPSASFDLGLVSHLLFLYSDQLDGAFHREAVRELLRVAREVRVFPVLSMGSRPSPHLEPVMEGAAAAGFVVSLQATTYEFMRGGRECLILKKMSG